MKTVFVLRDGPTAIPTTVYPGPTSPGTIIEYEGTRYTVTETPAFSRRISRHSSVGDEWEQVVEVEKPFAPAQTALPVKGKGKDKQSTSPKTLYKE